MSVTGRKRTDFHLQPIPMPAEVAQRIFPGHLLPYAYERGFVERKQTPFSAKNTYVAIDFCSLELRMWAELSRDKGL